MTGASNIASICPIWLLKDQPFDVGLGRVGRSRGHGHSRLDRLLQLCHTLAERLLLLDIAVAAEDATEIGHVRDKGLATHARGDLGGRDLRDEEAESLVERAEVGDQGEGAAFRGLDDFFHLSIGHGQPAQLGAMDI
ncbi:hypothetical protein PG987_015523 [Apiospora arundinis]